MNTSSSHEALLKATDLIRKMSDGLTSAHFSLTILEKDLLKKQCQELYEHLLEIETTSEHVFTPNISLPSEDASTLFETGVSGAIDHSTPVVDMRPMFEPEPEMTIEEVDADEEKDLPDHTDDKQPDLFYADSFAEIKQENEVLHIANEQEVEPLVPLPHVEVVDQPEMIQLPEDMEEEELTLNDKISKTAEKKSFLDRMMLTPIDNIKSHITLNKKVAFIIGLFNQESDDYNKAIEQLNTADNLQAALDIYHMLKTRYSWNPEQDLVKELEMLVRRRYNSGTT